MLELALPLFGLFVALLFLGAPIAVALGLSGAIVIAWGGHGILAVPTNAWTGIAKYPLLALPMFVLAGLVFERSGVALRLVRFAASIFGERRGGLAVVAIVVCMILGGISGSGPADAAAVASVMLPSMLKQGYPREFIASVTAAAGSTAILIPPSIAFIVYSVLVPGVSVAALFLAGLVPGILAGLTLMAPSLYFARRFGWGSDGGVVRPPFWATFKEAIWGLLAPVVILGGMRAGVFTPTEAAAVAVLYGVAVGTLIYRTLDLGEIFNVLVEAAEISAVVMIIITLATVFAHAGNTIGAFDAFANSLMGMTRDPVLMLLAINAMLLVAGMLLDAVSIFLVFLPILLPIARAFSWDLTWFGVMITYNLAIGQFTPPMAVNLMVTCKVCSVSMESAVPWVIWMVLAMGLGLVVVIFLPELSLFLPRNLGGL